MLAYRCVCYSRACLATHAETQHLGRSVAMSSSPFPQESTKQLPLYSFGLTLKQRPPDPTIFVVSRRKPWRLITGRFFRALMITKPGTELPNARIALQKRPW